MINGNHIKMIEENPSPRPWRAVQDENGMVQGSRKVSNVSYNNLGTGMVRSTTEKVQSSYTGASLGFDTRDSRDRLGVFAEIGFRNATSVGIVGTVGLNIGF